MEFGAGRGKLSHWIHEALKAPQQQEQEEVQEEEQKDLQLLLVERSSTRFKARGSTPGLLFFHQHSAAVSSSRGRSLTVCVCCRWTENTSRAAPLWSDCRWTSNTWTWVGGVSCGAGPPAAPDL